MSESNGRSLTTIIYAFWITGYYTNLEEGICTKCNCSTKGSISLNLTNPLCDMNTGKCQCKPHVNGVSCDDCEDGFYNINSDQVNLNKC